MRPALVFAVGRIGGYAFFGALLGALGATLALPAQITAVLMLGAAIVMTVVGTRLSGVSPRIATLSPTLAMGLGRRLGLETDRSGVTVYPDGRAATLGALSFFLPCGFTQAIQVFALSTGSPLAAVALLATFALGTAPGLLGLAGLPAVVPTSVRPALLQLAGVLVIGFAFVNASAGLRLADVELPRLLPVSAATAEAPLPSLPSLPPEAITPELQTFEEVDGYSPGTATIRAGIPTGTP